MNPAPVDGISVTQIGVFLILGCTLALFIWGRWRYDVVAVLALVVSVAVGVVPGEDAFKGFADPAVITVAAVLVLSNAIRSSGFLESALRPVMPWLKGETVQILTLGTLVASFSAFMNNVGALAIFLPVALRIAHRSGRPAAAILMPLSFASLLGGLITLVGTPPNLLISAVREDIVGEGFGMFDFTPVGLGVTAAGLIVIGVGWRLIPRDRRGRKSPEDRFRIEDYTTEVRVPADSPFVGRTVAQLENEGDGDMTVAAVVREGFRRYVPHGHWTLLKDDILLLEGDTVIVKRVADAARLHVMGEDELPPGPGDGDFGIVEAVVTSSSPVVGCTPAELHLRRRFGVNLLAIGRRDRQEITRLRRVRLRPGDVLVLQGPVDDMPDVLTTLGCLPLEQRYLQIGRPRRLLLPIAMMAGAVALASLDVLPVAVAFIGAILLLVLLDVIPLREIYNGVDWPVIVLLGALLPVSDALRTSGGTELIAEWLSTVVQGVPPHAALALILVATMLVTPVLNNAATVLVMAPIGAGLAARLGLSPDPFLMAVAVGASCDFLTPIGHQSNTLVMGPAGYRFGDYWRLGLPLSLTVLVVAVPLIAMVWPFR